MRKINIKARLNGTIKDNLKEMGYSSNMLTQISKKMGYILKNDIPIKINEKILKDEYFQIILEDEIERKITPYKMDLEFVYEDDDLAVINKPMGLTSIATREYFGISLENVLAYYWNDFVFRAVNRLDKDTTGLMIIAKNKLVHSMMSKTNFEKKYYALCDGHFKEKTGIVNAPIGLKDGSSMERCVREDESKYAETHYEVIKEFNNYSLVRLILKTGRTHQIRVHMAYINHPLCNDGLYNKNIQDVYLENGKKLENIALCASEIKFIHPIKNEEIELKIKPPFCCE